MTNPRLALRTGLFLACPLVVASVVDAQTTPDLFDADTLHELRLFVNSRDLALLRRDYLADTYYPADLWWGDARVRNVGVRSRGGRGSRSATKLHLRVDFDRYTTGQRLDGLRAVVLKNLWQQPSMIAEHTTMALFARMSEPAPRESFCRLYINDVYQGLYGIVEAVDEEFLARSVGEDDGYLFSYNFEFETPFWGGYLGEDHASYKAILEPETHEDAPDAVLYEPVRELFERVDAPVDAGWRARVEEYLDLPQFVTYLAIETFLAEEDGLLRVDGMNNFFLHRPRHGTRHRLFAWDKDRTFSLIERPILLHAEDNEVFRRAMAFPELRALYFDVLERCVRAAREDDWLLATIDRFAALISDAAREDPLKPFTNEQYEAGTEFLRRFARERPEFVLRAVEEARRGVGVPWIAAFGPLDRLSARERRRRQLHVSEPASRNDSPSTGTNSQE